MFYRADRAGLTLQTRTKKNGGHPAGRVPLLSIEQLEQRAVLSGDPLTVTSFSSPSCDVPIEAVTLPLNSSPQLDLATQSFFVGTPQDIPPGDH